MTKINFNFSTQLTRRNVKSTCSQMGSQLQPYKLRERSSDTICVVMRIYALKGWVYLFFREGRVITWASSGESPSIECEYVNDNFDFIGPLEPNESITITG